MTEYEPVGIDSQSLFPPRVEQRLAALIASATSDLSGYYTKDQVDAAIAAAVGGATQPEAAPVTPYKPKDVLNIGTTLGKNHFSVQVAPFGATSYFAHTQAQITAGYSEFPIFYVVTDPDGTEWVRFQARVDGPTTSGSSYARSELREQDEKGQNIAFNAKDPGTHRMSGISRIVHQPPNKPEIVIAQLHDGNRDRIAIRTQTTASGVNSLAIRVNGSTNAPGWFENVTYTVNRAVAWKIEGVGGVWKVYIDNMSTPKVTVPLDGLDSTSTSWYFKAGAYLQTNKTTDPAEETGIVELRSVLHWHTGWTANQAVPVLNPTPIPDTVLNLRGLNLAGPEFGGSSALWSSPSTVTAMGARGHRLIRQPLQANRMQPTLSGALDATQVTSLTAVLDAAYTAGIGVILDCHGYGSMGDKTSVKIGAAGGPSIGQYADFWLKMAQQFAAHPAVVGYDLMNEPEGMPVGSNVDARATWYATAQAAINAIRTVDTSTFVILASYNFGSSLGSWGNGKGGGYLPGTYGVKDKNVVTDSANKVMFTGHHYFDGSGAYTNTYAQRLALQTYPNANDGSNPPFRDILEKGMVLELRGWLTWLTEQQAHGLIGEFGIPRSDAGSHPEDAAAWALLLDRWWAEIDAWQVANPTLRVWATQWAGGDAWSSTYTLRMYDAANAPLSPGINSEAHKTGAP